MLGFSITRISKMVFLVSTHGYATQRGNIKSICKKIPARPVFFCNVFYSPSYVTVSIIIYLNSIQFHLPSNEFILPYENKLSPPEGGDSPEGLTLCISKEIVVRCNLAIAFLLYYPSHATQVLSPAWGVNLKPWSWRVWKYSACPLFFILNVSTLLSGVRRFISWPMWLRNQVSDCIG